MQVCVSMERRSAIVDPDDGFTVLEWDGESHLHAFVRFKYPSTYTAAQGLYRILFGDGRAVNILGVRSARNVLKYIMKEDFAP